MFVPHLTTILQFCLPTLWSPLSWISATCSFVVSPNLFLQRLQLIQNFLVRAVFSALNKFDRISSYLRRLYWLPIEQRIVFKIAALRYKTLDTKSPTYICMSYLCLCLIHLKIFALTIKLCWLSLRSILLLAAGSFFLWPYYVEFSTAWIEAILFLCCLLF